MLSWVLSDGGQRAWPGPRLRGTAQAWAPSKNECRAPTQGPCSPPHPAKAALRIHFRKMGALIAGRRIVHLGYATVERLRAAQQQETFMGRTLFAAGAELLRGAGHYDHEALAVRVVEVSLAEGCR